VEDEERRDKAEAEAQREEQRHRIVGAPGQA
jgi:hypothetical protein